jgi:hypothetical protein
LALFRARHPWRWLVFEVARSPAHPSVVGLSDDPVLLFAVTGGSFTVFDARARAGILSNPNHAASHLGLAFGVPAEPSRIR